MNFKTIDKNGIEVNCDVIGTFIKENKKFIVYTDGTIVNGIKEVYASFYEEIGDNNIKLLPIINDEDWDLVDNYLGGM